MQRAFGALECSTPALLSIICCLKRSQSAYANLEFYTRTCGGPVRTKPCRWAKLGRFQVGLHCHIVVMLTGGSPDPVLTGILIAQTIQGIQSSGVVACAKHFIGNEQEHFRQSTEAAGYGYAIAEAESSNIDDKTLHELYLWPFVDAVRAGVGSIMCSYNQVCQQFLV